MAEKSDLANGHKRSRLQIAAAHQTCTPEEGDGSLDRQGSNPLVRAVGQENVGVVSPEETVETIVTELFHRIDFGRLGQLQRKLKVNKNFFRGWKDHPDRARLLPLVQALAYLEIKPATFFAAVFNLGDPPIAESPLGGSDILGPINEVERFFATAAPPVPCGVPPSGVRKALERMAATSSQDEKPRSQTKGRFDHQELARLDVFRLDNPPKANRMLEHAIADAPMELLADILLVYGTTFRQLDRFCDARWAYFVGEMRAEETNATDTFAAILQRRSWVEFAEGNVADSLDLLRRAAGTFAELGDDNREAKVLVSMALQYVERGKFEEAVTCATSALQKLNTDEYIHRFSAHQVLAYSARGVGAKPTVIQNLEAARTLLIHCPKVAKVRFVWLEARLKKEFLPLEKAASVFEAAASFFCEIGEVQDSALAMLEFARCLVSLGRKQELRLVAESLRNFTFKIDDGRESCRLTIDALMEVYRAILKEEVTEAMIFSAVKDVQEAAGAPRTPAADEV